MIRREFITLLGCSLAAWPLAASAQQAQMPRIGLCTGLFLRSSRTSRFGKGCGGGLH